MTSEHVWTQPAGVFGYRARLVFRRTLSTLGAALASALVLLGSLALLAPLARAAQPPQPDDVVQEAVAPELQAGLFFRSGRADALFEAPTLDSGVSIDVSGHVARVTVRQSFRNPSSAWLEGIYVFPLPERSAVDRLVMTIGDRRVEGEIMETAEARRVYEQAAAEGRRASLLSSKRPNVFVTSVANVGPGEEIRIEIGYQDQALYDAGRYSYRFPMVVAPRYTPGASGAPLVRAPAPATRPKAQPIAHVDDRMNKLGEARDRDLFGPVRRPEEGSGNTVTLRVLLDAGLPLAEVRSLNHTVDVATLGEGRRVVTLAAGNVPADRDFVLEWRPVPSGGPEAAVFAEELGGDTYLLISLLPPSETPSAAEREAGRPPRDLIFVVDTSGSMHGPSIEQAKQALVLALERLRPGDRFNVIRFAGDTSSLFDQARPANPDTLRRATAFVTSFQAEGGTEMRPALTRALDEAPLPGRLRQVVFLTDGAVGNEHELFMTIAERLGEARLFTIGIGSAPNSFFMRKAAELGRGSFTYIGDLREVAGRMTALFRKLERPALTGVSVAWPTSAGGEAERYPARVPDLYEGEPVSFTVRLPSKSLPDLTGELALAGARGGDIWERRLALAGAEAAPGVAALWARSKVAEIMDGLSRGGDPVAVREAALAVALEHRLVTRFTSLVAVDDEVARPETAALESREVARDLPHGMDYAKVFGDAGKTMRLRSLPAPLLREAQAMGGQAVALPQTATPAQLFAFGGLSLLLLGSALLIGVGRARRLELRR